MGQKIVDIYVCTLLSGLSRGKRICLFEASIANHINCSTIPYNPFRSVTSFFVSELTLIRASLFMQFII